MESCSMIQGWRRRILYLANSTALAAASFFLALPSAAQLSSDDSLGAERSVVTSGADPAGQPADVIEGGARRGANLFHSFQDFNVGDLQRVYFANPVGVENILSRVTGSNPSNILGKLGVFGNANLFLINPNGILFGPNATLDIRGAFIASTANRIRFADGIEFNAIDPSVSSLLTISVPVGLQYGNNPGSIQVQRSTLQVDPGNSLALLGGSVSIDRGRLTAESGRIELGGLAEAGTVGLFVDDTGNILSSRFPNGVRRGNVSLSNGALVSVLASNGGSIAVNTRNLNMAGGGILGAGIAPDSGSVGAVAGNIDVDATGAITLQQSSVIRNLVRERGSGNAGNISIRADSLNLLSGSQLFASTYGEGDAGRVNVNVRGAILIDSAGNNTSASSIINSVESTAVGDGGTIDITTESLSLINGGQLNATTAGRGDAGNVTIKASGVISIDGGGPNANINPNAGVSAILTSVGFDNNGNQAIGNGGDINIDADSLLIRRGAEISAVTRGQGNAGDVTITANDTVSIVGERQIDSRLSTSTIRASVDSNEYSGYPNLGPAVGNSGDIKITTESLLIRGGAQISAITAGQGNAGDVIINASDTVFIAGENSNSDVSGIFSSVADNLYTNQPPARGDGGELNIRTDSLLIRGGAGLYANTRGQGDAGDVIINAHDRVSLDGVNSNGGASGIFSSVGDGINRPPTVGDGGDISIRTGSLSATGGAGVFASTTARGDAGNVRIDARDRISFDNLSGIFSTVNSGAVGDGQEIRISAETLFIGNEARLSTTSAGDGAAGNIEVDANSINFINGEINSDTIGGQGDITLRGGILALRRDSSITTNATGTSTGGNINVAADFIISPTNENNDIIANAIRGSGGQITLTIEGGIFGFDSRTREDLERLLNTTNSAELTPRRLLSNDITAFSQANPRIDRGAVTIQTPDLDPTQGLTALPTDLSDPSQLIAATCPADEGSSFAITGRGGLPEDPRQPLMGQEIWQDERGAGEAGETEMDRSAAEEVIVEAQGWRVDGTGAVVLVAQQPPDHVPEPFSYPSCAVSHRSI